MLLSLKIIAFHNYMYLIFFSIIFQLLRMSGVYLIILGFYQNVSPCDLFFILVLITFISMIPVSIGALGVQESGIVFGLKLLNIPLSVGFSVAFIYRGIFVFFAIIGGLLLAFSRYKSNFSNND